MIKTSVIPFIVTCLFYLLLGFKSTVSNISVDVTEIFKQNYNLNIIVIIPAILIIVLSLLKINLYLCTLFHPFLVKGILGVLKGDEKSYQQK